MNQPLKESLPRYFNRELSWLAFNSRVLEEAENKAHPLLERIKFLAISANNLDEFYMVRVAAIRSQIRHGIAEESIDGLLPTTQLERIRKETARLMNQQRECWSNIQPELAKKNVHIMDWRECVEGEEHQWLKEYFHNHMFPVLTPIAISPSHPFPFLPNLSLAVVLNLRKESNVENLSTENGNGKIKKKRKTMKAVIPIPLQLPRLIALPKRKNAEVQEQRFILVEEILYLFQASLFPGYEVTASGLIRITRDSELDATDEADDLMRHIESALQKRRRGEIIRIKVNSGMPEELVQYVMDELDVASEDVFQVSDIFGLSGLMPLTEIERPDLKFKPMLSRFPERISDYKGDCLSAIKAKDIVVHHPFESFDVVVQFIRQAAQDPEVIAIKQTLYRTSNNSPIVNALIEAAEAGKSVTVVVELKARFDEEANLKWGKNLERAGAQVIYSHSRYKVHAKTSLVIKRTKEGLESYVHFGTGNYHPQTAKVYTDLSYFTTDKALCNDAALLFNYMTGNAVPKKFAEISVAPLTFRQKILKLIEEEIINAKAGKPAEIWIKVNAVVDSGMIDALYAASQAGVKIRMIVRGICCLRPGVEGFSENISVKSVVGRFLEHSRVFVFAAGHEIPSSKNKVFTSSADLMQRNLDRRVELMVPIYNKTVHEQIVSRIMVSYMKDTENSWVLKPDGSYERVVATENHFSAHDYFINNPSLSGRGSALHGKKPVKKIKNSSIKRA